METNLTPPDEPLFFSSSPTPEPEPDLLKDTFRDYSTSPSTRRPQGRTYRLPTPPEAPQSWSNRRGSAGSQGTPSPARHRGNEAGEEDDDAPKGRMYWDTLGNAMGPYHPAWSGGEEADAGEGFMGRTGRKRARDEGSEEEDAPKEEGAGVVVVRQGYGQVTTKQDPIFIDMTGLDSEEDDGNDAEEEEEEGEEVKELIERLHKRKRLAAGPPSSSRGSGSKTRYARDDSSPLRAVSPCLMTPETPTLQRADDEFRTCGCTCGMAGGSKGGAGSGKLSDQVKGNILALIMGSPSGARKTWNLHQLVQWQYGQKVSWSDIALMVGAYPGDHDLVRACAKRMQETLPGMKRQGRF